MQIVGFPPALRKQLADLALDAERGNVSRETYESETAALIDEARVHFGLDDSWSLPPTLPEKHNPNGRDMVWWKP